MEAAAAAVAYSVSPADTHAHLFSVEVTIARPAQRQLVSLPVWIPGSYLVREFSKNLQSLRARQGRRTLTVEQLDKNTWAIEAAGSAPLRLSYQIYALDQSVRAAWLDSHRGFFNGTSLFLRVHEQEHLTQHLELLNTAATAGWSVATGLRALRCDRAGWGIYAAADYDELVDCPVEMGTFWSGKFVAKGVAHRLVVTGASASFDGERLLSDVQRICATEIEFWHGSKGGRKPMAPHRDYVFLLNAVDEGYGGLEHRNSTALICERRDLPRLALESGKGKSGPLAAGEGYTRLLGLISHEYFHTWNVKRLRPVEFVRYQYNSEQYTRLLWFFEGFTSYYDDLLLRRAKLIDDACYLKLLGKTLNGLQQTPGRLLQSAAQASMDAWIKYYRQDENTPNATVSYYTKGAIIALCLDLTLRREDRTNLDAVMRALWTRCRGGPMSEDDLAQVLLDLGGRSFAAELGAWVHGTQALPARELLQEFGVTVHADPAPRAQSLGLRVSETQGIVVKSVLRGGLAEQAGFQSGDEWLGLEVPVGKGRTVQSWRLLKLDDIALYAGNASKVTALVARDRQLLRLPLSLSDRSPEQVARLSVGDVRVLASWLQPGAAG